MENRQRLFSIFNVPDNSQSSRVTLRSMLEEDMRRWGYIDAFAVTYASNALRLVGAEGPWPTRDLSEAVAVDDLDALAVAAQSAGDGVAVIDLQWYWSLSRTSRSAMEAFDSVIFGNMYRDRHPYNICVEDWEQDVRQHLPDFHVPLGIHGDSVDSPLPPELRKRWAAYMERTWNNPTAFKTWDDRRRRSSSINALIRQLIAECSL